MKDPNDRYGFIVSALFIVGITIGIWAGYLAIKQFWLKH